MINVELDKSRPVLIEEFCQQFTISIPVVTDTHENKMWRRGFVVFDETYDGKLQINNKIKGVYVPGQGLIDNYEMDEEEEIHIMETVLSWQIDIFGILKKMQELREVVKAGPIDLMICPGRLYSESWMRDEIDEV